MTEQDNDWATCDDWKKCPDCGYKNEDDWERDCNGDWLCPKCKANLLTDADYKTVRMTQRIVAVINFVCWPFAWMFKNKKAEKIELELNGDGIPRRKLNHTQEK